MKALKENRGIPALKEIVEERKNKAIENLSATYAKNRLPLEEYERLVEYINKIESERELIIVEKMVEEYGSEESRSPSANNDHDDEADYSPEYIPHHDQNSFNNLTVLSTRVFSGTVKSGTRSVCILGSQRINIRKADLERQQTLLNVVSILGDTSIYIEPGIRVLNRAIPILGDASMNQKVARQERSGDPELVILGKAILGNITVELLKE